MTTKPRLRIVNGELVPVVNESPLEAARRKYGRPFGTEPFTVGEGARYWTSERVARLAAANEERRMARRKA